MINEKSKNSLLPDLVKQAVTTVRQLFLAAVCLTFLTSCLTREKVNTYVWLNNTPLPASLCAANPELLKYGFYRKLNDGTLEFVSFCSPEAVNWLSMYKDDFNTLMDKYLPKPKGQ